MKHEQQIAAYFQAMRNGPDAEEELLSLFASDAEYIEPFSGDESAAVGIDAIRRRFRRGWESPPPELELEVLTMEVVGDTANATWECRSPAFPGPVRGRDRYLFVDGLIRRLEVTIDDG